MKIFGTRAKKTLSIIAVLAFLMIVGLGAFSVLGFKKYHSGLPSNKELQDDWTKKNYEDVLKKTAEILERRPRDAEVRCLHGFAAYYVSSAQTNQTAASEYLDECIVSLRQALYGLSEENLPRLYYILGKAYYQKGYFYYDLALKYLNKVFELGCNFPDLNKFRGMAYSYLGENKKAIEAFTYDLDANSDEFLLFALAKNYASVGDFNKAKMYLTEAAEKATDVMLKLDCKNKLAEVYFDEENLDKAIAEYMEILEMDKNYSDAYYGLGLIYERAGNLVKARAEWRKALKANPLHAKAIEKLR